MKNTFRTWKQFFKVESDTLCSIMFYLFLCSVLGIFVSFLLLILEGNVIFPIGSLLGALIVVLMLVCLAFTGTTKIFNLAVSMGKTRKEVISSMYMIGFVRSLMVLAELDVLSRLEIWMLHAAKPQSVIAFSLHSVLERPMVFFGGLIVLTVFIDFFGAMYLRFGQRLIWLFWVTWIGFILLSNLFTNAKEHPDSFLGRMFLQLVAFGENATTGVLVTGFVIICTICVWITIRLLRRQWVTM